ncbi:hypothetical protein QMY03_09600 [Arthrobacter sp. KFRI-F3372]|nr:hypothetical protein QMY03_09600 [Arthrobacter sp. KFRI-F3372]
MPVAAHAPVLWVSELDFDTATAASFWERLREQRDSKASPPATVATEDSGAGLEESLFGTNRVGMAWWWTDQLGSLESTTGSSIRMLRAPRISGAAAENGTSQASGYTFWFRHPGG